MVILQGKAIMAKIKCKVEINNYCNVAHKFMSFFVPSEVFPLFNLFNLAFTRR